MFRQYFIIQKVEEFMLHRLSIFIIIILINIFVNPAVAELELIEDLRSLYKAHTISPVGNRSFHIQATLRCHEYSETESTGSYVDSPLTNKILRLDEDFTAIKSPEYTLFVPNRVLADFWRIIGSSENPPLRIATYIIVDQSFFAMALVDDNFPILYANNSASLMEIDSDSSEDDS